MWNLIFRPRVSNDLSLLKIFHSRANDDEKKDLGPIGLTRRRSRIGVADAGRPDEGRRLTRLQQNSRVPALVGRPHKGNR